MNREEYEKSLEGLSDENKQSLLGIYDNNLSEIEKLKGIKDSAFKERDDYKTKLKALEDVKAKADAEAAQQQGKYKELYESTSAKVKDLETEVNNLKPYQEKLSKYQDEHKTKMLKEIEDEELRKDLETKSYDEVMLAHNVYIKTKPKKAGMDNGRTGIAFYDDKKEFDDYSSQELDKLAKEHPDIYKTLRKKKYPQLA